MSETNKLIQKEINENSVVLFMKGDAKMPMCGFSSVVCTILQRLKVDFKDINVMQDNNLREGIKLFSDWPTIPQLYIKGEFVGGCDIVREMYDSGELEDFLKDKKVI